MNFNDILNQDMNEIEAPKTLPKGTYLFKVTKPYEERKAGKDDQLNIISFTCEVLEAGDQIDNPEALEAYGNPAGKSVRLEFMFNNEADLTPDQAEANARTANRLKKFIENALEIDAKTLRDGMTEAVNHQFYGVVTHRPNPNDPEAPFVSIGQTAPVE